MLVFVNCEYFDVDSLYYEYIIPIYVYDMKSSKKYLCVIEFVICDLICELLKVCFLYGYIIYV